MFFRLQYREPRSSGTGLVSELSQNVAVLRQELDGANKIGMPSDERSRLQRAIDTIAANMAQLAALLAAATETPSAMYQDGSVDYPGIGRIDPAEAQELEEILDEVLKWHAELIQNDVGE